MPEARDILQSDIVRENRRDTVAEVMDSRSERRVYLEDKWGEVVDQPNRDDMKLEGMRRHYAMMLLENQTRYVRKMMEQTGMSATPDFVKFIYPLIRDVWANLIAPNIVSVQPMNAPVGGIFFFDYEYDSNKGPTSKGDPMIRTFNRYYSKEYVDGEFIGNGDAAKWGGAGAALAYTTDWNPVRPLADVAQLHYEVKLVDENPDGTANQTAIDDGAGAFTGDTTAGVIVYATGGITAFKFTAAPPVGNVVKIYYNYDSEHSSKIPEAATKIRLQSIQAETRKMKAKWSLEGAQDMDAMLDIDVDSELVSGMSQEITLEVDRELVMDLYGAASSGTNKTNFDRQVPAGISEKDHIEAILTQIGAVSQEIHTRTLRGEANWLVTHPSVVAILNILPTFKKTGEWTAKGGIVQAGVLNEEWMVYKDPKFPRGKILAGHKGDMFMDAGYVYSPYVQLMMTQAFLDPDNFELVRGMMCRYATYLINSDYYGMITVSNL